MSLSAVSSGFPVSPRNRAIFTSTTQPPSPGCRRIRDELTPAWPSARKLCEGQRDRGVLAVRAYARPILPVAAMALRRLAAARPPVSWRRQAPPQCPAAPPLTAPYAGRMRMCKRSAFGQGRSRSPPETQRGRTTMPFRGARRRCWLHWAGSEPTTGRRGLSLRSGHRRGTVRAQSILQSRRLRPSNPLCYRVLT